MCRYGMYGPYKEKWACFKCRKSFKRISWQELVHHLRVEQNDERVVLCPQCKTLMHNMGLDFKAPKQTDVEQWDKVELLFGFGYKFSSCGCTGPGPRPRRLNEVPMFLKEQEQLSAMSERQRRLEERASELKTQRKKKRKQLEAKRFAKLQLTT